MRTDTADNDDANEGSWERNAGQLDSSQPRGIIWTLIIGGFLVIAFTFVVRTTQAESARTVEEVAGKQTKVTTTTSPPSDALLLALMGLGGVLVLAGSFYLRISKVTLPGGGGVEFARFHGAAAKAIGRVLEKQPATPETATEAAATVAAATYRAAALGAELSRLASREPAAAESLADAVDVDVDIGALASSGWIPREGWDRIAEAALRDVLRGSGED